ncbi:MAG: methyltransferase domain-containing protein [Bacteroidia bacterium]|nr:methyltransferase domain-containing protein [Bacteroidia bacterium]
MEALVHQKVTPAKIIETGMNFWSAKTLLAAVRLELFTHLAKEPLTTHEICNTLGLHKRSIHDFLDVLVTQGFLTRQGIKDTAVYANTEVANTYLNSNKPTYMGGILEWANDRLYERWHHLEDALRTGKPQNLAGKVSDSLFETIYQDKSLTQAFVNAMSSMQMANFLTLAKEFDFAQYKSCCDIGGCKGDLAIQIAKNHSNVHCTTVDLPQVESFATANVSQERLEDRVNVVSCNFFKDQWPTCDVITMSNVLCCWGVNEKMTLIKKAYESLPKGGALVVIENVIDDERRTDTFSLLMSLNMLVETTEGFNFTKAEFESWTESCGFRDVHTLPLNGATTALIAVK